MELLSNPVKTWLNNGRHIANSDVESVRSDTGFHIKSFPDLITKVAHLSFANPGFELLFRGQGNDYKISAGRTTLLPSILRTGARYFTKQLAKDRFEKLERAQELLCSELANRSTKGSTRLTRYGVLQWAILQHYEVCDTPLLDVTHSLRVACSFATAKNPAQPSFLLVLAVPFLSGSITTVADQGLQALRLLSVCPPVAHRPHFQEGYLIGEYPDVDFSTKDRYDKAEFDFARRLICKFVLPPANEPWSNSFPAIPSDALLPNDDPFLDVATTVKNSL